MSAAWGSMPPWTGDCAQGSGEQMTDAMDRELRRQVVSQHAQRPVVVAFAPDRARYTARWAHLSVRDLVLRLRDVEDQLCRAMPLEDVRAEARRKSQLHRDAAAIASELRRRRFSSRDAHPA